MGFFSGFFGGAAAGGISRQGGSGSDLLIGSFGNDTLRGGAGADVLIGLGGLGLIAVLVGAAMRTNRGR